MKKNYFIPKHKFDFEAVERIKNADSISIQPVLPEIFEWVEDINWPVAQELVKVLVKFNDLIIPFLKDLMQKPDGLREYSVYYGMMPLLTNRQLLLLKDELERVASNPSLFEIEEEYDKIARQYLQKIL
ncbi:DUF5071 domain-containing protein [Marinisporobacter balticus]|uniref:Uncharacterized protein DUF5071 n=1 Tax=Marinisporobacter balticus TaxID=2018667 RepID=A0A4R2K4G8_9FIRM|nr:DUF5071 domain-containing protein [Marinisporobacter balticus]TCO68061.1 uncharacterized protein DUF5071 [Marinisporobacter balticus]